MHGPKEHNAENTVPAVYHKGKEASKTTRMFEVQMLFRCPKLLMRLLGRRVIQLGGLI